MNVDGIELEIIDSTGKYDYQWSEFAVMRGDDGHLYVGDAFGRSGESFSDRLDRVTQVSSWQDAAKAVIDWGGMGGADLIGRLSVTRPVAFDGSAVVSPVPPAALPE